MSGDTAKRWPAMSDDDAAFRRGVRARDAVAWEQVAARFGAALRRRASTRLPAQMDPDDAVSEVWVRALQHAAEYDPERPVFPWLRIICDRICVDVTRRASCRALGSLSTDVPAPERATDEGARALLDAVALAIACLSPPQREVIRLRFNEGKTSLVAAAELLITQRAVERRLSRALTVLRRRIDSSAVAEWGARTGADARLERRSEHGVWRGVSTSATPRRLPDGLASGDFLPPSRRAADLRR